MADDPCVAENGYLVEPCPSCENKTAVQITRPWKIGGSLVEVARRHECPDCQRRLTAHDLLEAGYRVCLETSLRPKDPPNGQEIL